MKENINLTYEGNLFHIREEPYNYYLSTRTVVEAEAQNEILSLPEMAGGKVLKSYVLRVPRGAERVRELRIPAPVWRVEMENNVLPALEQVWVHPDNTEYSGNGPMLCSKDGCTLFYALSEGLKETATVPQTIRILGSKAFQKSKCEKIIFENPDVRVENASTFQDSRWLKVQKPLAVVGNLLYRLREDMERLEVPPEIRRFDGGCFEDYAPEVLVSHLMPSADILRRGKYSNARGESFIWRCRSLILTSPTVSISLFLLRQWSGLQYIECPENHRLYRTQEGILFSRDRKTLLFYPHGREEERYRPPETTVRIAPLAFADHPHLQQIELPDSVTSLGMGAFYRCEGLRKVRLPAHLRELPDASIYEPRGVFEECWALREIDLPEKLRYIGNKAFLNSGLQKIRWGTQLEEIGEYALRASGLTSLSLPPSLHRVRCGALWYVKEVFAYEGSARGLISAINAAPIGEPQRLSNLVWAGATIHVLGRNGAERTTLVLPESLKRTAAYHMELAWNDESVNYEEYDACFPEIQDQKEKLRFALDHFRRRKGREREVYENYYRYNAWKMAEALIRDGEDTDFLRFLQEGYMSSAVCSKALKLCGELERVALSAYILEFQDRARGGKKKRSRFVL